MSFDIAVNIKAQVAQAVAGIQQVTGAGCWEPPSCEYHGNGPRAGQGGFLESDRKALVCHGKPVEGVPDMALDRLISLNRK